MGHGTGRRPIGHEDFLFGIEHLGALTHKIDAGKDDDFSIRFNSLFGQAKRVADVVSIGLYLIGHVIVSEDNGLFFFFQGSDLIFNIHRFPSFQGNGTALWTSPVQTASP